MGDRVVDCARLESVCAERHRGFESPPIRQERKRASASKENLIKYNAEQCFEAQQSEMRLKKV